MTPWFPCLAHSLSQGCEPLRSTRPIRRSHLSKGEAIAPPPTPQSGVGAKEREGFLHVSPCGVGLLGLPLPRRRNRGRGHSHRNFAKVLLWVPRARPEGVKGREWAGGDRGRTWSPGTQTWQGPQGRWRDPLLSCEPHLSQGTGRPTGVGDRRGREREVWPAPRRPPAAPVRTGGP